MKVTIYIFSDLIKINILKDVSVSNKKFNSWIKSLNRKA